jgi:putative ABC transport system permease protein
MKALDRKLFRDLRRMVAQVTAIALVVASGVALFVATMTTYRSLRLSEDIYYAQQRFADVWANLGRAPLSLGQRIGEISGVSAVDARISSQVIIDVPGLMEPASAVLLSIPDTATHPTNGVYIRRGRHIEAGKTGEVLVSEAFAESNHLGPGDSIAAVVSGRRVRLAIVGVGLSPEYVMQVPQGGQSPEDRRFAVIWMARRQLESLVDLRGAFNDVALKLSPGADAPQVIKSLDHILEPYGGRGAYGRSSQASHVMLKEHIEQLKSLAIVVPGIFLLVAAFLVNVVLARIVSTEREQIGMFKAFGYSNLRVALHYLELAAVVVLAGILVGVATGVWLGRIMAVFYATFFRFPVLVFRLEPWVVAVVALITVTAAFAGALGTLRRVLGMPPIVAMSPEVPTFSRTFWDRLGAASFMPATWRMILRNVTRRPLRAVLTSAGMALAVAVVVLGSSSADGIRRMEDVQFQAAQHEDLSVTLSRLRSLSTLTSFANLPGVRRAEPYRALAARVGTATTKQDVTLLGLLAGGTLRRATGNHYEVSAPVASGALITLWLAKKFHLKRGDLLDVEIRDGRHRSIAVRVAGVVDEPLGEAIYMELGDLGRRLGEPDTYSGANLLVDSRHQNELYAALKRTPEAIAVRSRRGTLASFKGMTEKSLTFIREIEIIFSVIIAFGVVYNGARIALSERSRELATLRVLGFTRAEISAVLLGEIGVLAIPAVPAGLFIGYRLTVSVVKAMSSERMHMPLLVEPATYAFAVVVFMVAALVSAMVVRRRLDSLDLVAVLKARE